MRNDYEFFDEQFSSPKLIAIKPNSNSCSSKKLKIRQKVLNIDVPERDFADNLPQFFLLKTHHTLLINVWTTCINEIENCKVE